MVIMFLELLPMQPQIMSFSDFNRKLLQGISIFPFDLATSFLLFSKR